MRLLARSLIYSSLDTSEFMDKNGQSQRLHSQIRVHPNSRGRINKVIFLLGTKFLLQRLQIGQSLQWPLNEWL